MDFRLSVLGSHKGPPAALRKKGLAAPKEGREGRRKVGREERRGSGGAQFPQGCCLSEEVGVGRRASGQNI